MLGRTRHWGQTLRVHIPGKPPVGGVVLGHPSVMVIKTARGQGRREEGGDTGVTHSKVRASSLLSAPQIRTFPGREQLGCWSHRGNIFLATLHIPLLYENWCHHC
ncbi:hCG1815095 [Homo sapiens]|nr:hCG1815095 [Homo sapiens]